MASGKITERVAVSKESRARSPRNDYWTRELDLKEARSSLTDRPINGRHATRVMNYVPRDINPGCTSQQAWRCAPFFFRFVLAAETLS